MERPAVDARQDRVLAAAVVAVAAEAAVADAADAGVKNE